MNAAFGIILGTFKRKRNGSVSQVEVDPFVEGDGVAVPARLPITGDTTLDEQALTLARSVGGDLGRQSRTRPNDRQPFCQDENAFFPLNRRNLSRIYAYPRRNLP